MEEPKTMLIVDDPYDAREAPDPEAARRWYTETLPTIASGAGNRIGASPGEFKRGGDILEIPPRHAMSGDVTTAATAGSLAATPCQMMLGGGPGSPTERPCGVTPTVGGNGLYRYCERHMRMVASAGATTLQRDADQDLQVGRQTAISSRRQRISPANSRTTASGPTTSSNHRCLRPRSPSIDRVLAEEPPGSVRAIACRALTGVSLDEFQRASAQLRTGVPSNGARCSRCNGDDPNRVIDFISGLCRECERALPSVGVGDLLVKSALASIDRTLAEKPKSGAIRLVEVGQPTVTLSTTGTVSGTLAPGPVTRKAIRCENVWSETPTGKFECTATSAPPRETPAESLVRIKRDTDAGFLDAEAARAALSRMIYIQHDLKHGPGGTGRDGPCDTQCVKCAAEVEIERIDAVSKAASGVFGRRADRVSVDDPHGPPRAQRRECVACFADLTPMNTWHHTVHFSGSVTTLVTCSGERCVAWAQRMQDDARKMRERMLEIDTSGVFIGKAPDADDLRKQFGLPSLPVARGEGSLNYSVLAFPPPRPDGFSQSAVDAAKAVLLTPVAPKGGRK